MVGLSPSASVILIRLVAAALWPIYADWADSERNEDPRGAERRYRQLARDLRAALCRGLGTKG